MKRFLAALLAALLAVSFLTACGGEKTSSDLSEKEDGAENVENIDKEDDDIDEDNNEKNDDSENDGTKNDTDHDQTVVCEHEAVIDAAIEPTCTEAGKTEGSYCKKCAEVLKAQEEIPQKNHLYGDWVITNDPTDELLGSKERVCSICSYKDTDTIPKLDHVHKFEADWARNTTAHWHKCACGEKSELSSHIYGDWIVTKEASCTVFGKEIQICDICKYDNLRTISKLGHSWVDATCESPKMCSVCNVSEGEPSHNYVNKICTECGKYKPSTGLSLVLNEEKTAYSVGGDW